MDAIHNPIINMSELSRQMYLFAYDVPAESAFKGDDKMYRFLGAKRREVWTTTKKELRCLRLQESVYRVDPDVVETLDKYITAWKAEYKTQGFEIAMEVFPLATTVQGYETFVAMQTNSTLDWLEHIIKILKEADAEHEITSKTLKEQEQNIESAGVMIKSWYAPGSPDHNPDIWKLLNKKYEDADDLLFRVKKTATIIDPWKKMKSSASATTATE